MVWISNGDTGLSVRTKLNTVPNDGTTALVPQVITRSTPSGTGTVTFSPIAATFRDLHIVFSGASTAAATFDNLVLRFNNDSGSNYDASQLQGNGTAASSSNQPGVAVPIIAALCGSTAPASAGSTGTIIIPDYAQTTFHKSAIGISNIKTAVASTGLSNITETVWWRSAVAITRVDLILSGNWVAGSTVTLWGYP